MRRGFRAVIVMVRGECRGDGDGDGKVKITSDGYKAGEEMVVVVVVVVVVV
ncbi:hypothetical protein Hamer_G018294 [Homarus americanus]|uniref:Uncharacterized protein n=1 Tax=Homarus americanus TaxID=6706 RepID=A0A8J5JV83_HOMAM|nr:hypothetical protein Hamer_G018294 [Homarus americanus]